MGKSGILLYLGFRLNRASNLPYVTFDESDKCFSDNISRSIVVSKIILNYLRVHNFLVYFVTSYSVQKLR